MMKALILNSGQGSRMGEMTKSAPKCMTELGNGQSILSRQLQQLERVGIDDIVITTGPFSAMLEDYAGSHIQSARLQFINNPRYTQTNYIYSIYLATQYLCSDILMLHGDLVFSFDVLQSITDYKKSAIVISSTLPLPEKDFKAVLKNGQVCAVGIEFFDHAVAAQPLYYLQKKDWLVWSAEITRFVENNDVACYAENAFNQVSDKCLISPFDVKDSLCTEIDDLEDLRRVNQILLNEGEASI